MQCGHPVACQARRTPNGVVVHTAVGGGADACVGLLVQCETRNTGGTFIIMGAPVAVVDAANDTRAAVRGRRLTVRALLAPGLRVGVAVRDVGDTLGTVVGETVAVLAKGALIVLHAGGAELVCAVHAAEAVCRGELSVAAVGALAAVVVGVAPLECPHAGLLCRRRMQVVVTGMTQSAVCATGTVGDCTGEARRSCGGNHEVILACVA
ncbi:hypothetical protein AGDE_16107 [Angomonas deanei]|uniref:Uncharacterized protein n=1 Tax=Angomonas deanei TaxID=59799 RepID=A0A7G2C1W8_9TRYP|nr:hypothetical protein AGDE_16107 [Angomonas deanei]CAD2213636.1 hypothetical protein, conserved [Angomonas deanei]|eukprot:EPY17701.1 hypothetical protein AGDE_16107 [Angomonas deanei]